jgi:hypothetical protein
MKKLLTTTALVALLAAAPAAYAAEAITDQPTANDVIPDPTLTPPAAESDTLTTPDSSMQPMDQATDPAMQSQDQVQTPSVGDTTIAAQPAEKFLTVQAQSEWLASNIIGSTVYNTADENLGDINDILFNADGSVQAVIIGVGGFLGIGEKSVALAFSSIERTVDANGNVKLVLNASKEELDAAPAFVTVAEQGRDVLPPADAVTPVDPAPAPMDTVPAPAPETAPDPAPVQ